MKNKLFYLLLFTGIFIITFCYTYFVSYLNCDEIWNYGFSYNIASGLVPYRDFNMLQTPLLFFIGSIFIHVFGHHLWSVHILMALVISVMMVLMYKKIKFKSFILYPIILIYSPYSYNLFCLFLMIVLINIIYDDFDKRDIFVALIVSFIFLMKQSIGICLFIPMMYYSRNKLKSFIVFLIPVFILIIYLVYYNALYDFINYSFLGMLDFGEKNGLYNFVLFYIILLVMLLYFLVKSHFKNEILFFILMFQIVGYPIIDDYHFMIGFLAALYYVFMVLNIKRFRYKYFFVISLFFMGMYLYNGCTIMSDYDLFSIDLFDNKNSFLYGRNFKDNRAKVLDNLSNLIKDNQSEYDSNIFLFINDAYLVRLSMNDNPTKYDFILDGNMGYHGDIKIINELKKRCKSNKCLFVLQFAGNQINQNIMKYVVENSKKIGEIEATSKKIKHKDVKCNYFIYSSN